MLRGTQHWSKKDFFPSLGWLDVSGEWAFMYRCEAGSVVLKLERLVSIILMHQRGGVANYSVQKMFWFMNMFFLLIGCLKAIAWSSRGEDNILDQEY